MALTKCKECGGTVSTEAYTCPHCGAPQRNARPPIPPPIVVQTHAPQKRKKMGIFSGCLVIILAIFIIGLISAIVIGTINNGSSGSSTTMRTTVDSQTAVASQAQERAVLTPIPNGVTYTIIDENTVPGIKRSLDIRLNQKVSKEVLKSIAMNLKNSDSNTYERTFIGYYLPGMEVGAGAWATTHFNPNLEIRILGLTVEEEKALRQQPNNHSREIIGSWLDERPFLVNRITIFREHGKLFMEHTYKDGSSGKDELVESRSPLGHRFNEVGGSSAGDHWILDSNGNLQLYDNEGLIATAKKIK